MNTARVRVEQIAIGLAASIVVAIVLASSSRQPFSPLGFLVVVGTGLLCFGLSEIPLSFVRNRGRHELLEGGYGSQPGSAAQAVEETWLRAEEQKHHRLLVDSFFSQLKSLRVAPSAREPFHLDLFTFTPTLQEGFQLPIDARLSSVPVREEALSHLEANEYAVIKRSFDNLVDSVNEFNTSVDRAISALDLEGTMRRTLPDLRSESEPRPVTWENYYYSRNLWLALEKAAMTNADATSQIAQSGASLEHMMPWAAGYKLVMAGYTIAHTKELRDAETLQRLINESSQKLGGLVAKRDAVQSTLEEPVQAFREQLRKLVEDFNLSQRLFGRCHVEESLEEQAGLNKTQA